MSASSISRRRFIASAAGGAAALGLSARLARGAAGANERIRVGSIGVGGRGSALMGELQKVATQHNAAITAVCDVYRTNAQAAAKRAKEWFGGEPKVFSRFQDLLALEDIDAVMIATPDFAHTPIMIEALKAGKDVYVEKPMSITLEEANEALDLARKLERVVQVGTQRRSDGGYKAAAKLYAQSPIGQVSRVSGVVHFNHPRWAQKCDKIKPQDVDWDAYLFNRPKQAFNPQLLCQWQLYRACTNGLPGLWMTHFSDVLHMITGAKYPRSVVAHGNIYVWKDGREHTDTFTALLDYPEGFLMDWSMNLAVAAGGLQFVVHGTKGSIEAEKLTLTVPGPDGKPKTSRIQRDADESHMSNWLSCLRTRERPNADIQFGHQHSVATILSAAALNTGQRHVYDAESRTMRPG